MTNGRRMHARGPVSVDQRARGAAMVARIDCVTLRASTGRVVDSKRCVGGKPMRSYFPLKRRTDASVTSYNAN